MAGQPDYDFYVARAMIIEHGKRIFATVSIRSNNEREAEENIRFKYPAVTEIENLEITGYFV